MVLGTTLRPQLWNLRIRCFSARTDGSQQATQPASLPTLEAQFAHFCSSVSPLGSDCPLWRLNQELSLPALGQGEARPGEARKAKPGQARPSQAMPVQAKPRTGQVGEARRVKASQASPCQARPGQTRPSQARPSEARRGEAHQAVPGKTRRDQRRGKARAGQVKRNKAQPSQAWARPGRGQARPGQARLGHRLRAVKKRRRQAIPGQ